MLTTTASTNKFLEFQKSPTLLSLRFVESTLSPISSTSRLDDFLKPELMETQKEGWLELKIFEVKIVKMSKMIKTSKVSKTSKMSKTSAIE
jgi:hypothetical protein